MKHHKLLLNRRHHKLLHGQGLVEYALILIAIALIVMVVALGFGVAVQRLLGLVTGALGGHYDDHRAHTLRYPFHPRCHLGRQSQHTTPVSFCGGG